MSEGSWMRPAAAKRAVVVPDLIWAQANRAMIQEKFPGAWIIVARGDIPVVKYASIGMLWHPRRSADFTWVDHELLPRLAPGATLQWRA